MYFEKTYRITVHSQGNIQTILDNVGQFGQSSPIRTFYPDPFTGKMYALTTYPAGSNNVWSLGLKPALFGVAERETLATGLRFVPDEPPLNEFRYETTDISGSTYSNSAHSDLDIMCSYNDSLGGILYPSTYATLSVRVRQRSMAWSTANLNDFILVQLEIENIGVKSIRNGFLGLLGWVGVKDIRDNWIDPWYAVAGSLASWPSIATCDVLDTLPTYYVMSIDGRPDGTGKLLTPDALGVCFLGHFSTEYQESFSWETEVPFDYPNTFAPTISRDVPLLYYLNTAMHPYYWFAYGEIAYDQMFTAVDHTGDGWGRPPLYASGIASGTFPRIRVGTGPFGIGPGQKTELTYAIVGGEGVHTNALDFEQYWDPYQPSLYYGTLDFTDLMTNARWAKWVYDNPGVDSDGDGYFGKFRVCDGDTNWYEGDGVPDFRADIPPPSPKLKIIPSVGKLTIRWNGYYSENAIDPFTKIKDFEGYRVYMGLDDRENSFATLTSWDYPNFNRYHLREKPNHTFVWETKELPYTIDSLRAIYGEDFNPSLYTKDNPMHVGDSQYYFAPVDYNLSSFLPNGVHKVYPDAVNPGTDTTKWTDDLVTTEHGSPLPKYYECEYTIENVLPTVANYVSVTSFDFGFAKGNIPAKESPKRENQTVAYAQTSAEAVAAENLNVYVYPNPYIWQKDYHSLGYENRDNTQIPARSHRINFGNLPPKCTISIFSLDGDLVRSWEHNYDPSDPQGMHDAWDLITRNTMLAVAGLYYWVVESPGRTQIGKFVIIM